MARKSGKPASIVPPAPQPGDTVGIIAPASDISRDLLGAGCERLRAQGYKTLFFESILEKELYFTSSAEHRAWELEQMFLKPYVKAIVCARGGYGTNYLLPKLKVDLIQANPKM